MSGDRVAYGEHPTHTHTQDRGIFDFLTFVSAKYTPRRICSQFNCLQKKENTRLFLYVFFKTIYVCVCITRRRVCLTPLDYKHNYCRKRKTFFSHSFYKTKLRRLERNKEISRVPETIMASVFSPNIVIRIYIYIWEYIRTTKCNEYYEK